MTENVEQAHSHKRHGQVHRGRPGQNRIYQHLGVRDLREIIDRKRSERGHETGIAPPDPSFNYLKDPLRENAESHVEPQIPQHITTRKHYNKNNPSRNYRRDAEQHGPSKPKSKDIESPLNITVEFSTSTGEHVYKLDESTVLPTIKHVPDQLQPQNRTFRGRGRGRGRGTRSYQTRTIRNNRRMNNEDANFATPVSVEGTAHVPPNGEENWDDVLNENSEVGEQDVTYEHGIDNDERSDDGYEEHLHGDTNLVHQEKANSLERQVENLKLD